MAVTVKGPAQSVAFDRRGERLAVASGDRDGTNPDLPGQVAVIDLKRPQKWVKVEIEDVRTPLDQGGVQPGREGGGLGGD